MNKYSDKFINQIDKLKYAVIGFEFEFYTSDISFYKTLELLNQYLDPVKIWGFRQYHSEFKVDGNNFKIEPDLSGGSNMCELITGPLDYLSAKYYLIKILKFIQEYGYTTERCSIHFNISFDSEYKNLNDLNILKLILNIDEDEIYRAYPSRRNNVYAKSVRNLISTRDYDYFNIPISVVKNNMKLPDDKYFGVNFLNIIKDKEQQRLEFRYIGGRDYEKNTGQLIYFLERFIINTYDSIDVHFNNEDSKKLSDYLEDNITKYKNLSMYDNFISEFPTISLQIDQNNEYSLVSSYYNRIYDKIYQLVESIDDLKECVLNYVTNTQSLEIVDANIKTLSIIKTVDFINCELEGVFEDCYIVGSRMRNSQFSKSKLINSDAENSKILNCNVENSSLENCYFMEGYLNGMMSGGVFRSGEIGPDAIMDENVKVITDHSNFFDTRMEDDDKSYKNMKHTLFK